MVWPFSSGKQNEQQQPAASGLQADISAEALESVNPELEQFYRQALPIRPISLAPAELKARVEKEQQAKSESLKTTLVAFEETDANVQRRRFLDAGGHYIQTLWEATQENCAILGARYGECQRYGPAWRMTMNCQKEAEAHRHCLGLQRNGMRSMGFDQALDSKQRNAIKYKMDDLYSLHFPDGQVTEAKKKEFLADVEAARMEMSKNLYRVTN